MAAQGQEPRPLQDFAGLQHWLTGELWQKLLLQDVPQHSKSQDLFEEAFDLRLRCPSENAYRLLAAVLGKTRSACALPTGPDHVGLQDSIPLRRAKQELDCGMRTAPLSLAAACAVGTLQQQRPVLLGGLMQQRQAGVLTVQFLQVKQAGRRSLLLQLLWPDALPPAREAGSHATSRTLESQVPHAEAVAVEDNMTGEDMRGKLQLLQDRDLGKQASPKNRPRETSEVPVSKRTTAAAKRKGNARKAASEAKASAKQVQKKNTKLAAAKKAVPKAEAAAKARNQRRQGLECNSPEEIAARIAASVPRALLKQYASGCSKCRERPGCTNSCWRLRGFSV